jgi:general secretion pathway protein L
MNMDRIIARLPRESSDPIAWCINAGPLQHGSVEDLLAACSGKTLTALLPGTEVLLLQTQLPKSNRQRLLQAAPNAIEEQLADKLENLHCALGPQAANGQVAIAVVARSLMETWFNVFTHCPASQVLLIPDYLAVPPPSETTAFGVIAGNIATIRLGDARGFSIDTENLAEFLQWQAIDTGTPSLHLYHFDDTRLPDFPLQPQDITREKMQGEVVAFYQTQPITTSLNLLQGPYALKSRQRFSRVYQMATGAVIAGAFLTLCAGQVIQYKWLQRSNEALNQEIASLYHEAFPNAQDITSPRQRIEAELARVKNDVGDNHFLRLLHSAGISLKETPNAKLVSLDYHDKKLHLDLEVATFDELDKISKQITTYGVQVKRNNASKSGDIVKAQLILARSA